MAIQKNWDNSHFSDYLLYGTWPTVIAWALLVGFDWHENVDEVPEFFSFYNKDEKEYEEEYRIYKEEVSEYYKRKENLRRLRNFWISGELDNDRLAPDFFIDWALSKRFRPDWLDWAIERKLYIPSEPITEVTQQPLIPDPPTFDNTAIIYPSELDIAIKAWQAVSSIEGKGKPKARIRAWLDERYADSELLKEAKERICVVVNWDKTGGATRTN